MGTTDLEQPCSKPIQSDRLHLFAHVCTASEFSPNTRCLIGACSLPDCGALRCAAQAVAKIPPAANPGLCRQVAVVLANPLLEEPEYHRQGSR